MQYFKRTIGSIVDNHHHIILGSTILGANAGVYLVMSDEMNDRNDLKNYLLGSIFGAFAGACIGGVSPILIPGILVGGPGYVVAKLHSSLQESRMKAERQVVPRDLWYRKKEETGESQLR